MKRYNPKEIEPKWQQVWDDTQAYLADLQSDKPKYIGMSMFNYPSGAGIHIGHAMNYTISDVIARYKRQQGFESYHPVGWDAFGLPAENYAIKAGVSPQESMAKIIPSYHTQYKAMGWSNDWSKEIATCDPEYYKWTQWIFWKMHEQGLAYQDARQQWWCTKCQTVLANEQVIDGKCWRHDGPDDPLVGRKEVKQWFFKITEYADEMLQATHDLDWSDVVKTAQINWIGKSDGVVYKNKVRDTDIEIESFSAHFEACTANTFVAIAPDHPLLPTLLEGVARKDAILQAAQQMANQRELEGPKTLGDNEGIFTERYAVDAFGGDDLPIWITSYAIAEYGTGIVLCSAHDERDFAFAKKYGIRLKPTMVPPDEAAAAKVQSLEYCFSDMTDGILLEPAEFAGKVAAGHRQEIARYLEHRKIATAKTTFKIRDWSVSRQRYWGAPIPIVHCPNDGIVPVPEHELPVVLPELDDFRPSGDGRSALARATDWVHTNCPRCGGPAERETDTLDTYICSSWYELRYLDPSNSTAPFRSDIANKWMPVDFYNGADHATAHLIYVRFIARFFHKLGMLEHPEPFKKFLFNGKVTASDGTMFSKSKDNGVDPLEIIAQGYGADALRTYLMFAAPLDIWMRWDPQGVPGAYRFLNRVYALVQEFIVSTAAKQGDQDPNTSEDSSAAILRTIHQAIKKVTVDIEGLRYNTAIAAMMEATNTFYSVKAKYGFEARDAWQFALEGLVALVAPFAPHIADELWHDLGKDTSVQRDSWPALDESYLVADTITLAVQINGKLRATIEIDASADEATSVGMAKQNEKLTPHLAGKEVLKTIYVPGKLINFVVR